MLIYAAVGGFGLLLLLAMLLFGELGDHGPEVGEIDADLGGPSVFSTRVVAAFLAAFGAGGVVARYVGATHPQAIGAGVAAGVVVGGAVFQMARFLFRQQASSEVRMADLIGRPADVSVAIPAGGVGQVTLVSNGERTTHLARAADGGAIGAGVEVRITALRGDAVVVARADAAPPGGST